MYRGKHQRRYSRRSNKSLTLLVSFVLILALSVSGTVAFLVAQSDRVNNQFTPSQVTTQVTEKTSGEEKSNVQIKNTGDIEAYIRAAIVVTWKDKDGKVYGKAPVKDVDYSMNIGSNWKPSGCFYYHTASVAAGGSTSDLITSARPILNSVNNQEANAAGYYLNVEIIGSGIQSKPISTVVDAWGVNPSTLS